MDEQEERTNASGASSSTADSIVESWTVEPGQTRTLDIDAISSLKVGIIAGAVDIVGHDEPYARVEVHSVQGKAVTIRLVAGKLEVSHPKFAWDTVFESVKALVGDRARSEISILVPRAIAFSFGQVSAKALISGLRTNATLSTVSGPVQLDDVVGDVELNAVSGDIDASGVDGRFSAHSVSGAITVQGAARDISIDTAAGAALLDLQGDPARIGINTISGDTTIRLDAGLGVRSQVNTVSGKVNVLGRTAQKKVSLVEVDGASVVNLQANTVSGDVTVVARA